jgi:hypothetical protein
MTTPAARAHTALQVLEDAEWLFGDLATAICVKHYADVAADAGHPFDPAVALARLLEQVPEHDEVMPSLSAEVYEADLWHTQGRLKALGYAVDYDQEEE